MALYGFENFIRHTVNKLYIAAIYFRVFVFMNTFRGDLFSRTALLDSTRKMYSMFHENFCGALFS